MADVGLVERLGRSFPAELTGFVGRREDRAHVRSLLSSARLVTLTGFGGMGKTRLALRVASDLSRLYADGVWFVPFADISDPELVADVTASALGIEDRTARMNGQRLAEHLRQRESLLVFDNCEHVIDGCARLADLLLSRCPRLRILATSREPLRVRGEAVWAIPPLSIPARVESAEADAEAYESVQLFAERAGQVAPGFAVADENRAAIIEVCRHLDGMPLALELAAVRLRAMSAAELLDGLRRHWQLLDVDIRGAPGRHQTMTACLDWSHALCSPDERELWARLSVFVGGMEMDAIHRLASSQPGALPPDRVVQLVQSLVDKSILIAEPHDGRTRYRMLEVIRRFGIARLDGSGRLAAMRMRHRDWCAAMLAEFDQRWMDPSQIEHMRRVRREEANLRAALRFSWLEPGEAAAGLELAARLRKYSMAYGWFSEGRLWLHRLLPMVPTPSDTRLAGLHAACWLAVLQGDRAVAAQLLGESRELAVQLDDAVTPRVEQLAGWHELFLGDLSSSVQHLRCAVDRFADLGWLADQTETLVLLGMAHAFAGELDQAAEAYAECLRICAGGANAWARSYALQWGGLVAWELGEHEQALAWEKESLELKRRIQERLGVALCLEALAWIECETDPRRAAVMLGASSALWHSMGTSPAALPGLGRYHDSSEVKLKELLSEGEFLRNVARGDSLTTDAAIAYALDEMSETAKGPTSPPEASMSAQLTRREREVATLIADGLSNKGIADTLVISQRTAEGHVEHILVKLGFTSRAQIAAWVSKHPDAGHGQ